jgi:hypothetical protein
MASASIAISMKGATGTAAVFLGVDRGRRTKGLPTKLARDIGHMIGETAATQWGHGVFALARPFVDIASEIGLALEISGLARYADFVFHDVVIRLQIVVAERPVFECRSFGDCSWSVALLRFGARFEIPRIEPPALRPIMDGRSTHGVHHGMDLRAPRGR